MSMRPVIAVMTLALVASACGSSPSRKVAPTPRSEVRSATEAPIHGSLPPRGDASLAYDSRRATVVLFGGYDLQRTLADMWLWDGSGWALASPTPAPPARRGAAMAY